MKVKAGVQIGFLKVLGDSGKRVKSYKIWECECTRCGKIVFRSTEQLKTAISCGCYRRDRMSLTGEDRKKIFRQNPVKSGMENSLRVNPNKNNASSGIRGVSWDKKKNKWNVQIMHKRVAYNLGRFEDIKEAAGIRREAEEAIRREIFDQWIKKYRMN